MSPIETQRTSSPENALLDELKSTLASRWQEFDNQKNRNADHAKIKITYDGLVTDLQNVKTDNDLKNNQNIKIKIDAFLTQIDLSSTITKTSNKLTKLRDSIYIQQSVRTESGKLQQEVATNKLASTPDKKPETLPTTAEAAATVAAVGGTGAVAAIESGGKKAEEAVKGIMKPLEKIKKWSSDIGSAWDAGWELVKKGDISKGIGLFFAVLFGGNLKDALAKYAGKKDETKPADKKEGDRTTNEKYDRYYASLGVFQSINKPALGKYSGDVRSTGDSILRSEAFMNLDFNIVGSMMQKDFQNGAIMVNSPLHRYMDANVIKKLGYDSKRSTYESVQYALLTVYYRNNEGFVGKHISAEFTRFQKDNKNATIRQTVEALSDEIDIASKFEFSGADEAQNFITINPNTHSIEGSGGNLLNRSFSKETLAAFVRNATLHVPLKFNQKVFETDSSFLGANPEEVKKLVDFRSKIQENICGNQQFLFGKKEKYEQPLRKGFEQMTYYDTMKLYAMLGGKTEVASFGSLKSALIYTQIISLLDHDGDARGAYLSEILKETSLAVGGTSKYMPEGTASFLSTIVSNVGKTALNWTEDVAEQWWGGFKTNPGTTLSATVVGGLMLLYTRFFPAKNRSAIDILKRK